MTRRYSAVCLYLFFFVFLFFNFVFPGDRQMCGTKNYRIINKCTDRLCIYILYLYTIIYCILNCFIALISVSVFVCVFACSVVRSYQSSRDEIPPPPPHPSSSARLEMTRPRVTKYVVAWTREHTQSTQGNKFTSTGSRILIKRLAYWPHPCISLHMACWLIRTRVWIAFLHLVLHKMLHTNCPVRGNGDKAPKDRPFWMIYVSECLGITVAVATVKG